MDMQNVLDKLKQIENPSEDTTAAIKSAEAMTTAPAQAVAEPTPAVTAESTYTEYKPAEVADYAKLAGIPNVAVQTEPTTESVKTITEAQSPAQKAAFQKMLDAKKDKKEDKNEDKEEVEESIEEIEVHEDDQVVAEGPTRKDFQMVADLLKDNPNMADRKAKAQDYCDKFKAMNPRFDKERFMKACGVEEAYESIEEAYSPEHVADIIKKHEQDGNEVEMDPYKEDEAGFTVTFKDGKRRHYKYTQSGAKVTSLEPVDPLVDPDAPKRGRGRPKKEGIEETEVDELTRAFEAKLAEALPEEVVTEEVVTEEAEQVNESLQVNQTINDEGQESVNINAQGDHVDMVKQMMQLAGQPQGYEEYKGEEEPESEEAVGEERDVQHANTPHEQTTDVDTQLNKMSGGLNGPKDKSALRGDSVKLHDSKEIEESLTDLYKAYKG